MDFLTLLALGIAVWALVRSSGQRQRFEQLEQQLRGQLDHLQSQQLSQSQELARLREQALQLLRAHTTAQGRLNQLAEQVQSAPIALPPAAPPSSEAVVPVLPPEEEESAPAPVPAKPVWSNAAWSPPPVVSSTKPASDVAEPAPPPIEDPYASAITPQTPTPDAFEAAAEGLAVSAPVVAETPLVTDTPAPAVEPEPRPAAVGAAPPPSAPTPPAWSLPAAAPNLATAAEAEPAPSLKPSFDWETLLGVRGAAWLGAIALVIAGTLFAKYSIENDLIKPPLRVVFLILMGLGALASSELLLRPRYLATANALSGAGVAILYGAFFAAHNLYQLVGLPVTFVLMVLTTVAAALLAARYNSIYIAVLGLLGGFATPLTLSTGQDRPFGLFAYILLLDLGFLWLSVRRGWHRLALLSLLATLVIEVGWATRFLSPEKMPIGIGVAVLFAGLFVALPLLLRNLEEKQRREILYGAAAAGLLPFVFACVLAAQPDYAKNWALLFGMVVLLNGGLLWLGLSRWLVLVPLALVATLSTEFLWILNSLSLKLLPVAVGVSLALMLLYVPLHRLYARLHPEEKLLPGLLLLSMQAACVAPLLLGCLLASEPQYASRWPLLYVLWGVTNLAALWTAMRRTAILALPTVFLTVLAQALWAFNTLSPSLLPLTLVLTFGGALGYVALPALTRRLTHTEVAPAPIRQAAGLGGLFPLLLSCVLCSIPTYGARWPLIFGAVVGLNGALLWLAQRDVPGVGMPALLTTLAALAAWSLRVMTPAQMPVGISLCLLFCMSYLALPKLTKKAALGPEAALTLRATAGLFPFALAFYLAGTPEYAARYLLLFGFVFVADAALLATALLRVQPLLPLCGAVATALVGCTWATGGLTRSTLWGGGLSLLVLALLLSSGPRLLRWRQPTAPSGHRLMHALAAVASWAGLVAFSFQVVGLGLAQPPWLLLVLLAAQAVLLRERSRQGELKWVASVGGLLLAVLAQVMLANALIGVPEDSLLPTDVLLRGLVVPLLLASGMAVLAALRTQRAQRSLAVANDSPGSWLLLDPTQVAFHSEMGGVVVTLCGYVGLVLLIDNRSVGAHPGAVFASLLLLGVLTLAAAARREWTVLSLVGLAFSTLTAISWQQTYFQPSDTATALLGLGGLYVLFAWVPLLQLRFQPRVRSHRSLLFAAALTGPALLWPLYQVWVQGLGRGAIGFLPTLLAGLSVAQLWVVQKLPQPQPTAVLTSAVIAQRHLGHRALLAAVSAGLLALAIPLQLHNQWVAVAWSLEAAAVLWIYRRLPHPGLKYFGLLLYLGVVLRLIPTYSMLHYHSRGLPVLNWLLYSYGVPCLSFLVGAAGLRRTEAAQAAARKDVAGLSVGKYSWASVIYYVGLVEIFVLINLLIADAFSPGTYAELWLVRSQARDLTRSTAWGVYALILLIIGMRQDSRMQRFFSLGVMLLTIAKVFLYDLSNVGGIYRPLSFLGLAVSLILVSLLYQRFVFQTEARRRPASPLPPSAATGHGPPGA